MISVPRGTVPSRPVSAWYLAPRVPGQISHSDSQGDCSSGRVGFGAARVPPFALQIRSGSGCHNRHYFRALAEIPRGSVPRRTYDPALCGSDVPRGTFPGQNRTLTVSRGTSLAPFRSAPVDDLWISRYCRSADNLFVPAKINRRSDCGTRIGSRHSQSSDFRTSSRSLPPIHRSS
jgi:hypothetical protein